MKASDSVRSIHHTDHTHIQIHVELVFGNIPFVFLWMNIMKVIRRSFSFLRLPIALRRHKRCEFRCRINKSRAKLNEIKTRGYESF